MLLTLSIKYTLLVFIADLGVLQLAADHNSLKGLLFFTNRILIYVFAVLTIGFPLFVFFNWNSLFATGVIQGTQQALLFLVAFGLAVIFTVFISSVLQNKQMGHVKPTKKGIDVLKETTFFNALHYLTGPRK